MPDWITRMGQGRGSSGTESAFQRAGSFESSTLPLDRKFASLKKIVHKEVIDEYNTRFADGGIGQETDKAVMDLIHQIIAKQDQAMTRIEESRLAQEIFDDVLGLGPLEPFLRDPTVSEIMVNGANQIYIERYGKLELTGAVFRDNTHVLNVINRIVSSIGRRCDESTPMVDARLKDGSRVNAVIPPIAIKGPTITIRKFAVTPLKISDLIAFGTLSPQMASFLEGAVKGKCNIIVSGGTGSGKTTLLNVLSGYIPDSERIVTVEDAAELQLSQNHVVTLESRPSNVEGKGMITIRDLVRNALRMRPDRIVVGEVRSGEALDMLQAMNTGHEGSLTTVHANAPRDVISRLETMVMMAGFELPVKAIREQVTSAVDLIVHQARLRDGSRKIVNISEVLGMEGETVTIQDIFVFQQEAMDRTGKISGQFVPTGIHPRVAKKIRENGGLCKDEWFSSKGQIL